MLIKVFLFLFLLFEVTMVYNLCEALTGWELAVRFLHEIITLSDVGTYEMPNKIVAMIPNYAGMW